MAVLLGLLVVASVVLGGRIPGTRTGPPDQAQDSPASIAGVVTLLAASLLIMAVALMSSFRKPIPDTPASGPELPRTVSGPRARLGRRLLFMAAALAIAWLFTLMVVSVLSIEPTELRQEARSVPTPTAGDTGPRGAAPTSSQREPDGRVLRYLEVTTVALVVMTLVGTVAAAVRRWRITGKTLSGKTGAAGSAAGPSPPLPGPEPLALAAERGLAEVGDLSRGPRAAIIACYAAMEAALAMSPGSAPRESDTPSEVLERAVRNHTVRAGDATTLVRVFAEARFSGHVMTEDHREVAERALRAVLDELGRPVL